MRSISFTIGFLLFCNWGFSQDTVYYYKSKPVTERSSADRYNILFKDPADTSRVKVLSYTLDGTLMKEQNYKPFSPNPVLNGTVVFYNWGKVEETKQYVNGKRSGEHRVFWPNGKVRRIDQYKEGVFQEGKCFTAEGKDTTWCEYFSDARFPGGDAALLNYINTHIKIPNEILDHRVSGEVKIGFFVSENGAIENVRIEKSLSEETDKEAIRLIKEMPKWLPARNQGIPTVVFKTQTILFK